MKPIVIHKDGFVRFTVDREYNRIIVHAALRLARKKVLIASFDIASHPPYEDRAEKRETDSYHYLIYKADGILE